MILHDLYLFFVLTIQNVGVPSFDSYMVGLNQNIVTPPKKNRYFQASHYSIFFGLLYTISSQVLQNDLFEVVKWPFLGLSPWIEGQKGHFEEPGPCLGFLFAYNLHINGIHRAIKRVPWNMRIHQWSQYLNPWICEYSGYNDLMSRCDDKNGGLYTRACPIWSPQILWRHDCIMLYP